MTVKPSILGNVAHTLHTLREQGDTTVAVLDAKVASIDIACSSLLSGSRTEDEDNGSSLKEELRRFGHWTL